MAEECSYCGETADLIHAVCGEELCGDCLDTETSECANCNNPVLMDNANYYIDSYETFFFCSRNCFRNATDTCPNCGDRYLSDDGYNDFCSENCYYNTDESGCGFLSHWDEAYYDNKDVRITNNKNFFDTKGFSVGVEIECVAGDNVPNYKKELKLKNKERLFNSINFKEDCSIHSDSGIEIVTVPTVNNEFYKLMTAIDEYLVKYEFTADNSCGLHIHIGEPHNKKDKILSKAKNRHKILMLYNIYRDQLFSLVKPERSKNNFCFNKNATLQVELLLKKAMDSPEDYYNRYIRGRYNFINMQSYSAHKTIEIRLHHGTVNRMEIMNWVDLNTIMFDYAVNHSYGEFFELKGTWNEFRKLFLKKPKLKTFFLAQRKRMKSKVSNPTFNNNESVLEKLRKEFKEKYGKEKNKFEEIKNKNRNSYGYYPCSYKPIRKKDFTNTILAVIQ